MQALLVSALKQLGQPVTPARVRRAVENTACVVHKTPEDTLSYGHGLLQVRIHAALLWGQFGGAGACMRLWRAPWLRISLSALHKTSPYH